MATRPEEHLEGAIIREYDVPSGKATTRGFAVKHSGADDAVENAAAVTDEVFGIALETKTAGQRCRVALFGYGVAPMLVGTGGIARGQFAQYAATGGIDMTVGGGTGKIITWGQALQTGAAGDYVGVNLAMAGATVGS